MGPVVLAFKLTVTVTVTVKWMMHDEDPDEMRLATVRRPTPSPPSKCPSPSWWVYPKSVESTNSSDASMPPELLEEEVDMHDAILDA